MLFENISLKLRSALVGIFILTAYGVLASGITSIKVIVLSADIISGLSVIGIAVLMYVIFTPFSKKAAYAYLTLKFVEGIIMIIGGFLFLNPELHDLRDLLYNNIHIYTFIISALLFYFLFLKSKTIPAFISIWGIIAIFTLLLSSVLKAVNIQIQYLDYLLILIIANEIFLAIWLMIKGLNQGKFARK